MNFAFSSEQEEFRAVIRRFVQQRWPVTETRRLIETESGFEPSVWQRMAGDLGLQGLAIPERLGGSGCGFLELGIALEELGRELAGGPYFATACLAVAAIRNAGSEAQQAELLPSIAAGGTFATLAVGDAMMSRDPRGIDVTATQKNGGWRLSGRARWVIDGQNANLLIVAARERASTGEEGLSLFVVRSGVAGLQVRPTPALDLTRRIADLRFEEVVAMPLGEPGTAWPAIRKTLDQAAICTSAEQVGGAARSLEQAVEYARERIQFGRPIGSFQAIKHRAADVKLELELARSAAYWAWWVADQDTGDLARATSLAKSICSEAFLTAAAANIHIHGGMGFTWEHDAHLYYRRAKASEILLGDPIAHRAQLADQLGLPPADPS